MPKHPSSNLAQGMHINPEDCTLESTVNTFKHNATGTNEPSGLYVTTWKAELDKGFCKDISDKVQKDGSAVVKSSEDLLKSVRRITEATITFPKSA
jgi:hypothetical protein